MTHSGAESTKEALPCNLISELTAHHFCHILFARSESLGPTRPSGTRLFKEGRTSRGEKSPWAMSGDACITNRREHVLKTELLED